MPSFHYQQKLRKQHRRSRKKIKRKIQGYILLSACVLSVVISVYKYNYTLQDTIDTNPNARQLLNKTFDGYYINSLDEFPSLVFTLEQVRKFAWIIYFFGMFFCFLGIAIICDDYFVPAIEIIVVKLEMSEDTAGATWMAAGGSTPELFTSFVGTFLAKSDIGFGTIVGSAVFNVLFVIGTCAIFTSGLLKLQWWPFARDMSYYLICLGVLSIFFGTISKNQMYWWESLILLCMYFIYVFIMRYNERIKACFVSGEDRSRNKLLKKDNRNEISITRTLNTAHSVNSVPTHDSNKKESLQEDNDSNEDEGLDLAFPDTLCARLWYIVKMPLTYPIYYTLFDVSKEKYENWWPWTFFGSLIWLGGLSYLMVWWSVVVGYAWRVPQEIMGLVFLAAGTSVPELFSCIIVAKKGMADMAVSASIGSNIFDILVGLPLPWLSYSLIYGKGKGDLRINVQAHGLFLSILVLIAMLSGLLIIVLVNKWTLTHCMGYSMIALYALFVAQDLLRHYSRSWNIEF